MMLLGSLLSRLRLARGSPLRKPILSSLLALIGTAFAVSLAYSIPDLNEPFYDLAYRLRKPVPGNVVIVTADQESLDAMKRGENHWAWPWPRVLWGLSIAYVEQCGAKAAAVDILFTEPSSYDNELPDDKQFAELLDGVKMPVVFGGVVAADGSFDAFTPPVKRPAIRGSVNFPRGSTVREYASMWNGMPSLALQTLKQIGAKTPSWAGEQFRLHYYGKYVYPDGRRTFKYVKAAELFEAAHDPEHAAAHNINPAIFKDKIVIFGSTAPATFDLKASPLDDIFPGVEVHATAIENLLHMKRVQVIDIGGVSLMTAIAALAASVGATTARRTWMKLGVAMLVVVALLAIVAYLFRQPNIVWLPPMAPLLGTLFSVVLALSWSYFTEDKQARFFLKALGQYVSPHVAAELKADPSMLKISTAQRELTILFSDIAHFTDISERLQLRVGALLNFYLDEMSQPVWDQNGTVDKYIGDAVMSFWNAPLAQADHAASACRAALAMQRRLARIQPELAQLGAPGLDARIGIATGVCTYGNMGARSKFNYSVIGDACNFASRLEGANKIYSTHILLGDETARQVRDRFVVRKVDLLQVKGKQPQAVYELIGEGKADKTTAALIDGYETAFARYCASDWDNAERNLLELLKQFPQDGPTRELLSRIAAFREEPPPAGWDGVFVAKTK